MAKQIKRFLIKNPFIILFLAFSQTIIAQTTPISLQNLEGKWYIHYSNFPMWLKGDKLNPSFTYTVAQQGQKSGLKDAVQYVKKGVVKQISGFDTPTDSTNQSFIWRGAGLLKFVTSRWHFIYVNPNQNWAIIQFEKTIFTPAGYDVIARQTQLAPEIHQQIQSYLKKLNIILTPITQNFVK
jgi:lipocalin